MIDKDTNASYSALTAGAAGTVTTLVGSNSFTFTTLYDISAGLIKPLIPAVGNATTTDLEYYMSRIDTVVCDSYGDLVLIKGEEKEIQGRLRLTQIKL